ncbi:helix-turn-helix transcriptional regulator [Lysinibacillus fusiformis]|uniref:helix-turn-helix transcriptional regulator n=1 Tax=Lysinibacillus fusiformis TaxID=28031 RepID=UPI003016D4C2
MRDKLIKLRGDKTLTEVAQGLEITRQMLSAIEVGVRTPSLELARKISIYYSTTIEDIFFESERN